jgi:predicted component of type VI protein secretion system
MDKTLFEKLTCSNQTLTLKQSVINNIARLLSCGGFLDDEIDQRKETTSDGSISIYPNNISAIVDQSSEDEEQFKVYQAGLEKMILRFEPRIKNVKVNNFRHQGTQVGCSFNIELHDEFEQHFVFNQG